MRKLDKAWWEHDLLTLICGADGDGDGGDGGAGDGGSGGDGSSGDAGDGASGDDGDSGDGDEGDDDGGKDTAGLKSALAKERLAAKTATKEAKRLQKIVDDAALKDKTEVEQATIKATQADEKAAKLAAGYKKTSLDFAISEAARDMKFIDVTDALSQVDRGSIEVEQDEDDPSEVTIDAKSVKKALDDLAKRKKHLIQGGTNDGDDGPSGSKFGGGKGKDKGNSAEALKEKYPSLR